MQDVHRKSFDLPPQWTARSYDISFSSGSQRFMLKTARPAEDAPSTPAAGTEFEVVWVNEGTELVGRGLSAPPVRLVKDRAQPGQDLR